jgi:hypothetical protein
LPSGGIFKTSSPGRHRKIIARSLWIKPKFFSNPRYKVSSFFPREFFLGARGQNFFPGFPAGFTGTFSIGAKSPASRRTPRIGEGSRISIFYFRTGRLSRSAGEIPRRAAQTAL